MKNLFEQSTFEETLNRVNKLSSTTKNEWGKMNVAQMLAHASTPLEYAIGDKKGKQSFMGMIFKPFAKNIFFEEKPYKQNLPTAREFKINAVDQKEFDTEKKRLLDLLTRFRGDGKNELGKHPHIFLGKITSDEWARTMYKHLDHHLRQFGV